MLILKMPGAYEKKTHSLVSFGLIVNSSDLKSRKKKFKFEIRI